MEKIQIKCPACDQQFAVSQSYEGRMVECGTCDNRFRVDFSTIIKEAKKRYYPGERSASDFEAFGEVQGTEVAAKAETNELGFEPASYSKPPNAAQFTPSSPLRTLAVISGILILLLFILIYFLGSRPGGMLSGMAEQKRMLLAVFIVIIGSALIIGGARRKLRGIIAASILSAGLIAFPVLVKPIEAPSIVNTSHNPNKNSDDKLLNQGLNKQEYADAIGFSKVLQIRADAKENGQDPTHVKAMVIIDIGPHTDTITEYLIQQLELVDSPVAYTSKRFLNKKNITLLVFKTPLADSQIIEVTKRFGTPATEEKLTKLQVIEVTVDSSNFISQNLKILTDQTHPEFFKANLKELSCLANGRQLSAMKRLAKVSVSLKLRSDIATTLASKISVKNETLSDAAINALRKWTLPEYKFNDQIRSYAEKMSQKGYLDQAVMTYLIEQKVSDIAGILAEQWLLPEGHLLWNQHITDAKSDGELALIKALPKNNSSHLKVTTSILKKIGTSRAIPALEAAAARASKNDKKYLKDTIDEIKSRS